MSVASEVQVRDRLYVGGEWVEPSSETTIDVVESATEEVIGRVPDGDSADVDRAARAARAAFDGWAATPLEERIAALERIAEQVKSRLDVFAETVARELGMPVALAGPVQVKGPIAQFRGQRKLAEQIAWREEIGNSIVLREPVGVVGAITPWNFPLQQISTKVAPAMAAGCTVVVKPSEMTPLTAFLLADAIEEAGLPAGVFNLVSGTGPVTGEALASHPEIDVVSFTGSTRAGRRVSELAAQSVKSVTVELGGKSPNVILDDADLEAAIADGIQNCFLNSGQVCSALTRMLVPRERLAEAEELATRAAEATPVGDPFAEGTFVGPLVSATQRDRVRSYIERGVEDGAKLLTGGADAPEGLERGFYVRPTVFSQVDPESAIAQEEIFGPVLAIIPYDDEDEAVRIANDTIYGLSGAVWSGDEERAIDVAARIRTGQISINGGAYNPLAPFGGFKQSGHGRENGRYGLEEYLSAKALQR
ncbi:MAG: aldehyde dehydrogenase family protein [Solirubrobacteraceae bacterium]